MPLSEKVRVEIFIPDLPDPAYSNLLEELGDELTFAFGGCTTIRAFGKYLADEGLILPDRLNVLFTDTSLRWDADRLAIERYANTLRHIVADALSKEETVLIALYPICHAR
ncbi:MAG TPA: hypothetical protein VN687_02490 [Blastocatellia bacterium]|nr:hypothetical protein [Blastocatellia bacterium]